MNIKDKLAKIIATAVCESFDFEQIDNTQDTQWHDLLNDVDEYVTDSIITWLDKKYSAPLWKYLIHKIVTLHLNGEVWYYIDVFPGKVQMSGLCYGYNRKLIKTFTTDIQTAAETTRDPFQLKLWADRSIPIQKIMNAFELNWIKKYPEQYAYTQDLYGTIPCKEKKKQNLSIEGIVLMIWSL